MGVPGCSGNGTSGQCWMNLDDSDVAARSWLCRSICSLPMVVDGTYRKYLGDLRSSIRLLVMLNASAILNYVHTYVPWPVKPLAGKVVRSASRIDRYMACR